MKCQANCSKSSNCCRTTWIVMKKWKVSGSLLYFLLSCLDSLGWFQVLYSLVMKKIQGMCLHVYFCVCVLVCIFIFPFKSKNNGASASRTNSETEEPFKKMTRKMKLYVCKSRYCSSKFVNNCVKIKIKLATTSLAEAHLWWRLEEEYKDRGRSNSKAQLAFPSPVDDAPI